MFMLCCLHSVSVPRNNDDNDELTDNNSYMSLEAVPTPLYENQ